MTTKLRGMILEGIVTTINSDGTPNISPMGPEIEEPLERLVLKPFQSSTTYKNLKRSGEGVFHVTDDVELFAHAAVGQPQPMPELIPAEGIRGFILAEACRWYSFRVRRLDDSRERTRIEAAVVLSGRIRDFCGFNRAKHAVIEAAILATRVHLLSADEILSELSRLGVLVDKTGGRQEHSAFAFLDEYVHRALRR